MNSTKISIRICVLPKTGQISFLKNEYCWWWYGRLDRPRKITICVIRWAWTQMKELNVAK